MASDRNGDTHRVTVLIDTNAFLMSAQFTLDLYEELRWLIGGYRPVIPRVILNELNGIARGSGKDAAAARFGIRLAERCEIIETENPDIPADDQILEYAKKTICCVVTNDRNLRDRLLNEKIEVISMKGKKKLGIIRR